MPDKVSESISHVRELLKDLVTAENTEGIAKLSKEFDNLEGLTQSLKNENLELKDKVVEMVKGTITSTKPSEVNQVEEAQKSLDEIMIEEANKIAKQDNRRK